MRAIDGIELSIVRGPGIGICLLVVALLAGCAAVPHQTRMLDIDRLNHAIVLDDAGYVLGLVESGQLNVNQRIPAPVYLEGTPLITLAARAGSLNVLRYLICAGADLNARIPAGETALMLAVYFRREEGSLIISDRHEDAVRMLVAAGANLENEPHHYTPLACAAYQGNEHVAAFLLEHGTRVDGDAWNGFACVNTPLMMAEMQGHERIARGFCCAPAPARGSAYIRATPPPSWPASTTTRICFPPCFARKACGQGRCFPRSAKARRRTSSRDREIEPPLGFCEFRAARA